MYRKFLGLVASATLLTLFAQNLYSQDFNIGVLAPRGALKASARWQEFGKYISSQLDKNVNIIPLPPAKVTAAADNQKIDFLLSHSPHTVYVQEKLGAKVLATLNTKAGPKFGGVIISKKGSGITTYDALKGKNVMSLKFKAAAGAYIFQTYHLLEKGIDPHKDFASLKEGKKQDDLVLAVQNGFIDAAFVRTGLLENMQKEGKISLSDFEIVDRRESDGFALQHTTALYPEWCFSALPHISANDAESMSQVLMEVNSDLPAAQKARIQGFVAPLELDGIKEALKSLHIAPYQI